MGSSEHLLQRRMDGSQLWSRFVGELGKWWQSRESVSAAVVLLPSWLCCFFVL